MQKLFIVALCLCLTACGAKQAAGLKVTKVVDGDTLVLEGGHNIELAMIDAPEREQPFGRDARDYLRERLENRHLDLDLTQSEHQIMVDGLNLNLELVRLGLAWVSPKASHNPDAQSFLEAQKQAVQTLAGFWGAEHALRVPPWQWRKQMTEPAPSHHRFQRPLNQPRPAPVIQPRRPSSNPAPDPRPSAKPEPEKPDDPSS